MVASVAGGVPVKGAPLLPTMRLPPGVRTPRKQVHRDGLPSSKSAVALLTSEVQTPQKEVHHESLPPSKAVVALLGHPHQHPAALAPAQCYSQVQHSSAVYWGKRTSAPHQSYKRGGGLAAAAATPLYCGHRCISVPSQSWRRGEGLAAAAAIVLYRRRHCGVARTVSHDSDDFRFCTAVQMPSSKKKKNKIVEVQISVQI